MVLIKESPKKVVLPPPEGGQTPSVPSFRVTERMIEEFHKAVEKVEAKRLKYTFTALSKDDTSSMRGRGWEDAFGTSDKAEAGRRYTHLHQLSYFLNEFPNDVNNRLGT
ncbi:hypothetical protein OIU77_001853 [Salix suchowensis]|uniref:Uncharacterized protein n=1 Tax=Salix suchowensis TaxID=1278906 RepID=A0ABQ9B4Q8_9ROSI|nr:hypothetical protein OIU77_001853 [Salix suchowensis]